MAEESPLKELCEDSTCYVCMDFSRDPVTIAGCGHTFCRACLTHSWGEQAGAEADCPLCRGPAREGTLRPNQQLANLVEMTQELRPWGGSGQKRKREICEQHQEPLELFCREDEAPLCLVCSRSKEHNDHRVIPLEEAAGEKKTFIAEGESLPGVCQEHQKPLKLFCMDDEVPLCVLCDQSWKHQFHRIVPAEEASQEYKNQFYNCLEILRKKRKEILEYKPNIIEESQDLLKQTKEVQQKTVTQFRQLHKFQEEQEERLLAQMEEVEREIAMKRDQQRARLSEELSSLESLIREMEEKCQQPAGELLWDTRSTLQRYEEKAETEHPVAFPLAQKWPIWDIPDLNSPLEGMKKQIQGRPSMEKCKKRKISEENRAFNDAWTDSFAFISDESGLPLCLICGDRLANNKRSNVARHFQCKHTVFAEKYPEGEERKKAVSELKRNADLRKNQLEEWMKSSNSTTYASFVAAQEIVRHGKPFTDGEYMKESFIKISEHLFAGFKNKREIVQKIREMPLSVKTVKERTIKMAENITKHQIKDINSAAAYSIACDGSKDKSDIEQIALFCRYVNSAGPQEEMVELIPLKCQTRGEDVCEAVLDCLRAKEIKTTHLVSVATDGAPGMTGAHRGFVALLQKSLDRKLLTFHCILHQEALCAQTFPPECTEVMNVVIQIINEITAEDLNHHQFRLLLDEVESTYSDLLLRNRVHWLSRGEVLKRFAACLGEVKTFLSSKGLTFPELEQPEWLEKLHFVVDMTANLNTLNTTLQGRGGTALHMLEEVLAFERKLTVFVRDLQRGTLSHFPSLREFKQAHKVINSEYLQSAITTMQASFEKRFHEFRQEKTTLSFPVTPLTIDPSLLNVTAFAGVSHPELELELADIADKDMWVSKFKRLTEELEDVARQKATLVQNHKWSDIENLPRPDKLVFETWNAIPDTYINMKKYAFGVLSIFGSTYVCEQLFSAMNDVKNKHRSHLTDDSLQSCLKMKVTSYSPDLQTLCTEVQEQESH